MDLSKIRKILIIRLSSLGDILLTTPLIRSLKEQYPLLEIDFLIREEYTDTIKYNTRINNIFSLPRNYKNNNYKEVIKNNNYDLIIDLQNNLRSRRITGNSSAKIVRYKKPYIKRFLLVKFKINKYDEIISIPERYAESINDFKLDNDGLELFLPDLVPLNVESDKTFIGLCPGSRHKTKMWPENYFIELGNKLVQLGFGILLFGGKDDKEICQSIAKNVTGSVNLSNDNNLLELAANMKLCKAIICNDSGLMHTASALKVPVIAIFGSTVKEFGFTPYNCKNLILENNSLTCRPCSHIGLDECPKRHLDCMNELTPNLVLKKTIEFVETL